MYATLLMAPTTIIHPAATTSATKLLLDNPSMSSLLLLLVGVELVTRAVVGVLVMGTGVEQIVAAGVLLYAHDKQTELIELGLYVPGGQGMHCIDPFVFDIYPGSQL